MKRAVLILWTLATLAQAQPAFWDAPTRGAGNTQAEAIKVLQGAKSEVFLMLPALYGDLGKVLAALGSRRVQVRVVVGKSGVRVSNGIALLGRGAQVRVAENQPRSALGIVDRSVFLIGAAVWNPRERGFRWFALPAGSANSLLDQLTYVWQAAKPLPRGAQ
jgi:hypothetical protein